MLNANVPWGTMIGIIIIIKMNLNLNSIRLKYHCRIQIWGRGRCWPIFVLLLYYLLTEKDKKAQVRKRVLTYMQLIAERSEVQILPNKLWKIEIYIFLNVIRYWVSGQGRNKNENNFVFCFYSREVEWFLSWMHRSSILFVCSVFFSFFFFFYFFSFLFLFFIYFFCVAWNLFIQANKLYNQVNKIYHGNYCYSDN